MDSSRHRSNYQQNQQQPEKMMASNRNHSTSSNRTTQMALAFLLLLISSQIVSSAPAYDYDNLRNLYEILLRQESNNQAPFVHQMERKGGRGPTLRLRFGRRSDPLWRDKMPSITNSDSSSNSIGSDDNLLEKVPYK